MRWFGRWFGRAALALVLVLAGVWLLVPLETVERATRFDPGTLGPDLNEYLAAEEALVPGITPGTEKRIIWAGAVGARTRLAVIYLHGFSATSEEIRPVPDLVAKALGANLYFTRLTGHGLTGEALAKATSGDWLNDLDEALVIGARIGEQTLIIGTSTGGTLAAIAATDPALAKGLAGVALISPNFRLKPTASVLLDLPGAPLWGPWLAGPTRSFAPMNATHATYWTTSYPTAALFPLAALMRYARARDFAATQTPALFIYSEADQVVDEAETAGVAARWGGAVVLHKVVTGPKDDPYAHVIAGAALSPARTAEVVRAIVDWAGAL